jgi:AcrR family transcriptional regulator
MPKRNASYMEGQRKRIVLAAYRCFRRDGLHQSSMADICAEAKLSMGAIYGHFASKEEILFGVFGYFWEEFRRKTAIETWADFDREYLQRVSKPARPDDLRLSHEMMALATVDATVAQLARRYTLQANEYLVETLERLHATGEIDPPSGVANASRILRVLLAGVSFLVSGVGDDPNEVFTLKELRSFVEPILQPRIGGHRSTQSRPKRVERRNNRAAERGTRS